MDKSKKVFIMGIDGMDPRVTQKFINEGIMPNLVELLKRGAASEDMAMIGGHPTVTPPMWTTLSTGAYPVTHGILSFQRIAGEIGMAGYNFDSRNCLAEQLWNVTAEAGLKTLVWHWPGSSWPPTSDSPNLFVVDGTQPEGVNVGNSLLEDEMLIIADVKTPDVLYRSKATNSTEIPCFISGMEFEDVDFGLDMAAQSMSKDVQKAAPLFDGFDPNIMSSITMDVAYSPIVPASGWVNAPKDAKECIILNSKGLIRRPCLILKNADGIYDTVQIFKSKKDTEPITTLINDKFVTNIVDDIINEKTDEYVQTNRNARILEMAEDGSHIKIWFSGAMDFHNDTLWHPKSLLAEVIDNVGYPQPPSILGCQDLRVLKKCMLASWDSLAEWNSDAIQYLMKKHDFQMVFSHFHNIGLQGHMTVQYLSKGHDDISAEDIQNHFREIYKQTDRYIGSYLRLIDEGWTIFLVSDHGQTCPEHHLSPLFCNDTSFNAKEMVEWGYTVLKKDENGNVIPEIDWTKTRAIMWKIGEVWLNVKGRDSHDGIDGIVDPAEKWELEEEIMDKILGAKSEKTGKRFITMALRNKDAVLLGMGGPMCGDIIFYNADGYTFDHADALSTSYGVFDTSQSSIFVAAGPGIKKNFRTKRIVRHADVVPTIATLFDIRMPNECEGAPVYQIFDN